MSAVDFFDSNVLIYLFDAAVPAKQQIARQLVAQAMAEGTGCISHEMGCTRLYSEDLQDGQQIEGLIIENPFRS